MTWITMLVLLTWFASHYYLKSNMKHDRYIIYSTKVSMFFEGVYLVLSTFTLNFIRKQPNLFVAAYTLNNLSLISVFIYILHHYEPIFDPSSITKSNDQIANMLLLCRIAWFATSYLAVFLKLPCWITMYWKYLRRRQRIGMIMAYANIDEDVFIDMNIDYSQDNNFGDSVDFIMNETESDMSSYQSTFEQINVFYNSGISKFYIRY